MPLLLDTNILIPLMDEGRIRGHRLIDDAIAGGAEDLFASVASLWEIAIKTRTGRLLIKPPLMSLPRLLEDMGLALMTIDHRHVLQPLDPEPPTRDPFDRLLLAQCAVENLHLVTLDRSLVDHPLVWRPA